MKPIQREKAEQAHIVQLIRALGGRPYVLGVRRRRGDFQGTMQSPGVPDVIAFLPVKALLPEPERVGWRRVEIEVKGPGGRLRADQAEYRELTLAAGIAHLVGDYNAFVDWCISEGYLKPQQVPHYRTANRLDAAAERALRLVPTRH